MTGANITTAQIPLVIAAATVAVIGMMWLLFSGYNDR